MNAEIIAVGSELLLGQITNTNAQFISKQLSELGINVFYHTVVGDNARRLEEAIEIAEKRANLIIFSGGLGPTKDDLTKETIARHLNLQLQHDETALVEIQHFFEKIGRPMTDNNRKQALVLEGCTVLANHFGMAPGMYLEQDKRIYILLPGPPKELHPMFSNEAKPLLAKEMNQEAVILSHVLRFYGIGEAELESRVQHLLDAQTNPTIAPLASDGEVTLRITAKADSEQAAWNLIDEAKQQILEIVGEYLYGVDEETLPSTLVAQLVKHKLTISAAESLTAGLFCAELAEIPGVSAVLEGYRSPERQNRLSGNKNTTLAKAYQSYHQFGLAADVAFKRDGKVVISERDPWAMRGYQLYGEVAESVGLTWGGRWKSIQDI